MARDRKGRCDECKWPYPNKLLNTLHGSRKVTNVCGICALAISNDVHGTYNRTGFTPGTRAEEARLAAIEFRKQHPELKPKED